MVAGAGGAAGLGGAEAWRRWALGHNFRRAVECLEALTWPWAPPARRWRSPQPGTARTRGPRPRAAAARGSLAGPPDFDEGQRVPVPQELHQRPRLPGGVSAPGAEPRQPGPIRWAVDDLALPPRGQEGHSALDVARADHQRRAVKHPAVQVHLPCEATRAVSVGLDLEPVENAVDKRDIDANLTSAEPQLLKNAVSSWRACAVLKRRSNATRISASPGRAGAGWWRWQRRSSTYQYITRTSVQANKTPHLKKTTRLTSAAPPT